MVNWSFPGEKKIMWELLFTIVFGSNFFPSGSDDKESACNAGDLGSIPGLGRSPGEENGNPLQYSCQENPMDRGAWGATVHRGAKGQTQLKWLIMYSVQTARIIKGY